MPSKFDIAIAGAGIGGLCAATALAQGGAKVAIYESAAQLLEIGAGLQLSANAMHVMDALGLKDQIIDAGFAPQEAVIKDWRTGRRLLTAPLGAAHEVRYGQPYIHIHRAALHAILLKSSQAASVEIHLGRGVTGYNNRNGQGVLCSAQGDIEADIIIGADGIKSSISGQMNTGLTPGFTGQTAWRGLVPASALPEGLFEKNSTVWAGPGQHIVVYYVKGPNGGEPLLNFVAVKEQESWQAEGWSHKVDMQELCVAFDGWDAPIVQLLKACEHSHLWGLFDRAPLPRWCDGRAALLGDAAHPMLPFMAQGAAMAIEDSYVLARCLGEDSLADLGAKDALKLYEHQRAPRAAMLQAKSRNNTKLFHLSVGPARLWRDTKLKIGTHLPAARHSQFDPIYGVNVTQDEDL